MDRYLKGIMSIPELSESDAHEGKERKDGRTGNGIGISGSISSRKMRRNEGGSDGSDWIGSD